MRIKIDKNSRARNYRNYEENRQKPDSRFHRAREREMLGSDRVRLSSCTDEMLRGFNAFCPARFGFFFGADSAVRACQKLALTYA